MNEAEDRPDTNQTVRYRWMIAYYIDGDLKFISHHDTLRLFERALARARLPVRFTEGFNPHPKMTIPLPRPVGVASIAEFIIIETTTDLDPQALCDRLDGHTPTDLSVRTVRRLAPGEKPQPKTVRYRLEPEAPPGPDTSRRIDALLAAESIEVQRKKPGESTVKTVDIRPWVLEMGIDGTAVTFELAVSERGTAKPAEIAGLLGYDPSAINHRIRRTAVQWR